MSAARDIDRRAACNWPRDAWSGARHEAPTAAHRVQPFARMTGSAALRVSDLMHERVHAVAPTERIDDVFTMMRLAGIRHVTIVEEGNLVGVASDRDILLAWQRGAGTPIGEVMTREPRWVSPDTTARDAAAILLRHKIGCLPVLDPIEHRVVGVVTDSDFLALAHRALMIQEALEPVMGPPSVH